MRLKNKHKEVPKENSNNNMRSKMNVQVEANWFEFRSSALCRQISILDYELIKYV